MHGLNLTSIISAALLAKPIEIIGPRRGDIVVYGWHDDDKDKIRDPNEIGHTGILSFVPGTSYDSWIADEAEKWLNQGTYGLGKGPRRRMASPFDEQGRADCSKFVTHCCNHDRFDDGMWFNTDGIVRDGRTVGGRYDLVDLAQTDLRRCKVIHCHGGKGPAVTENFGVTFHRHKAIVVRYTGPAPT